MGEMHAVAAAKTAASTWEMWGRSLGEM